MKKFLLMLLSLIMALSSVGVVPVLAEETTVLPSGYAFVDIAHNGNTYVAMAKATSNWTAAKLYLSTDGGVTWESKRDIGSANVSACPQSQQQLVYWEEQGVFVAHCAGTTLTSADGATWTANANIWTASNEVITVSGRQLISSQTNQITATDDLDTKKVNANKHETTGSSYPKAVAAKPINSNGKINILMHNQNRLWDVTIDGKTVGASGETYNWTTVNSNTNQEIPDNAYDMVYNEKSDQFISIGGKETLLAAENSQLFTKIPVKAGVNITGIGVSDKYIVVGMADGTMYYTANTSAKITADTVWTQIPAQEGSTVCNEPIKLIEFSDDESFMALSSTQVYKASVTGYANPSEYRALGAVTVSKESIFKGVRLIGGVSATIDGKLVLLVYGDTVEPDADGKRYGKIFLSNNVWVWEEVYSGLTFSKQNLNEDGSVRSYNEVRNGAVWWEAQKHFIISASTQEHTGISLVSSDGRTWTEKADAETDFRLNTDIAIAGDKLYTTNNGRQFRTYTSWDKAHMSFIGVTNVLNGEVPSTWYMNQIAVSDEADPAVFIVQNGNGAVRNNKSAETEELKKWSKIDNVAGSGAVTDSVYNNALGKFIAVSNGGLRTSIIGLDGTVTQGPIVPNGVVCNAIATDKNVLLFAGNDGAVYCAYNLAEFSKETKLHKALPWGTSENTMNVTNVFYVSEGLFLATVSDNKDSDVLILRPDVFENYEYEKASDALEVDRLVPGDTVNVSVQGVNRRADTYPFTMVTAVYAADGTVLQIQTNELELPAQSSGTTLSVSLKLNDDLPEDADIKVMLWDSVSGMVPLKGAAVNPF